MTRKKKIVLVVVIVIALAVAGLLVWLFHGRSSGTTGGVFVQSVNDVNAASTGLANRYSGVVETQKTEKVAFDTSKTLKELLVQEGQQVTKGTPLFTYDTQSIDLQIQQAELEIEKMNTTISNDQSQITQLEKDMKAASSADKPSYSAQIQDLQAEIAQTEYNVKSKQAEIDKLKASIDSATVTAGMDGTVESIADLDLLLSGGLTNSDGSQSNTYIEILASGDLRVKGKISEQTIQGIYQDMPVIVRSRVDPTQYWNGTISTIDTQASADSNVYYDSSDNRASKYAFYVNLESIDGLMLGQHVTIEPDHGQATVKDGIWLNSGWIVQEDDGSAYVWAAKEGRAKLEKRSVELGEYDSDLDEYQIVSGLANSDYLAWPDTDCVVGAATTTEYVFDDSEMGGMDDGMGIGDGTDMDEDFGMDGETGMDDGAGSADAAPIGGEDTAVG